MCTQVDARYTHARTRIMCVRRICMWHDDERRNVGVLYICRAHSMQCKGTLLFAYLSTHTLAVHTRHTTRSRKLFPISQPDDDDDVNEDRATTPRNRPTNSLACARMKSLTKRVRASAPLSIERVRGCNAAPGRKATKRAAVLLRVVLVVVCMCMCGYDV